MKLDQLDQAQGFSIIGIDSMLELIGEWGYCDRCGEIFCRMDLVDSYVGMVCRGCYPRVMQRVLNAQKIRTCPPIPMKEWIYEKNRHI